MIALCFILAGLLAVALGVTVWAVRGWVGETKSAAKSEIGATHFESALELAHFELEQTRQAHAAATARATALEQLLAEEAPNANADLDPADWRTRELRLARAWATADAHRLGPDAIEPVPAPAAADETDADLSSPTGVDGV